MILILIVADAATGHSSGKAQRDATGTTTTAETTTASTKTGSAGEASAGSANPFTVPAVKQLLSSRHGQVTAAVADLSNGRQWLLNPSARDQTASIVKADILATLLYQAQQSDTPLSDAEADTATGMIEASDNDDASDLWSAIGGAAGLDAFNAKAGLSQTTANTQGYWGETLTSAADQIKLLRQLARPTLLNHASVAYQLGLMEDIDPGENWGVTGGVPAAGVTVALKNGWVPLTSNSDWEVNSIGWVRGDGHNYLIAVLTAHDPSEQYGIDTIDALSKLVYDHLGPAPAPGTALISASAS